MARITFEGNFCDISMCRENPCPYNGMCSQRQTWERLKEYEDTGFDPEEIADFMKRWEQTVEIGGMLKKYCIDHIRGLLQAEQDGRLVVLDEPMRPLVWGDKEHDTILCPRCLCDLMGGFEYAPSCETVMFQCPHCGQPIKSDKAIDMDQSEAEAALKGGDGL